MRCRIQINSSVLAWPLSPWSRPDKAWNGHKINSMFTGGDREYLNSAISFVAKEAMGI